MKAWLEGIAGPEFAPALMWTVIALIALLVLLVVVRIVRGLTFGTFVAGGRNRKARLAVMDATAVDSQRRLVLVRRDDVEHLILIGGPTDVVVEQNIRLLAPATARRPAEETAYAPQPQPQAQPAPASHPPVTRAVATAAPVAAQPVATPRPVAAPPIERAPEVRATPAAAPSHAVTPSAPVAAASVYRPATPPPGRVESTAPYPAAQQPSVRQPVATAVLNPAAPPTVAMSEPKPTNDLDSALLEELQVSLQNENSGAAPSVDLSLDEEMSRLLSDLSAEKRR